MSTLVPSASGITASAAGLEVVGDDYPAWVTLDSHYQLKRSLNFWHRDIQQDGRIDRTNKPDFEALMTVQEWQGGPWKIALASGSVPGTRDWALVWGPGVPVLQARPVAALFAGLRQQARVCGTDRLNIEGMASTSDRVYLANRINSGKNMIFHLPLAGFMAALQTPDQPVEDIAVACATLAKIAGVEAGLSGLEYWPERQALVYTASVEATASAVTDGAILGSLVGLLPLAQLGAGRDIDLRDAQPLLDAQGKVRPTKLESVAKIESNARHFDGVLVSDNDDGRAEFFRVRIQ